MALRKEDSLKSDILPPTLMSICETFLGAQHNGESAMTLMELALCRALHGAPSTPVDSASIHAVSMTANALALRPREKSIPNGLSSVLLVMLPSVSSVWVGLADCFPSTVAVLWVTVMGDIRR